MSRAMQGWRSSALAIALLACASHPQTLHAGEGGTSHVLPGATLGDFKGMTSGVGPVPGSIKSLGNQSVAF